jgi:hypothetical protein
MEHDPGTLDFRRANGAPMVRRVDDPSKWDRYSRPSGWGDDLDEQSALVNWRIDRAIDGVASSQALAAKAAALRGLKTGRKELREEAIKSGRGEEAADLGTALHAMSHRVESGDDFLAPEPYATDLATYLTELERAGLFTVHCEIPLCADGWRAAGTADRIYEARIRIALPGGGFLEPGQRVIGDLKTGAKFDYSVPGYCIQLAIYSDGVPYDVERNVRLEPIDNLRNDWGVLVHMPAGSGECSLWWTDLTVGRLGARIVREVREWRKRNDFVAEYRYPVIDETPVLDATMAMLEQDVPVSLDEVEASPEWFEAMTTFATARIQAIGLVPDARAMLLRKWPASIPPLRQGAHTAVQLSQILSLLDSIESAFSLPFPPGDPRPEWDRGLHRSEMQISNEPRTKEHES